MASAAIQTDYKPAIIDALTVLMKSDQIRREKFKVIAYQKVLKELRAHEGPIYSLDDLENIKGIGAKIRAKIQEILETGSLQAAKEAAAALPISVYDDLLKVHGIGPAKARKLVEEQGIKSIDDLRTRVAADPTLLDAAQKIGLKYFEEFIKRIPRIEMTMHENTLLGTAPANMKFEIVGSYRRGAESSGDIDVLINFPRLKVEDRIVTHFHQFVQALQATGYITEILALGNHKCMAVCQVPGGEHRRLDLLLTPNEEWAFAILYFTGSDRFNVAMRAHALELGYTLNEHRIARTDGKEMASMPTFKAEKDIFDFLKLTYVKPSERTGPEALKPL